MRQSRGVLVAMAVLLGVAVGPAAAEAPAPAPGPAASGATMRIAYIDVQRVLARSSSGVAAREQLEREKTAMQREMDGKRVELEKLRDELEKKAPLMAADARREKQEQYQRKRRAAARPMDASPKALTNKGPVLPPPAPPALSGASDT